MSAAPGCRLLQLWGSAGVRRGFLKGAVGGSVKGRGVRGQHVTACFLAGSMRLRLGGGLRRLLVLVLLGRARAGCRACFRNGLGGRRRLIAAVVLWDVERDTVWLQSSMSLLFSLCIWWSCLMTSWGHNLYVCHEFQLYRGVSLFPPVLVLDSWGKRGEFVLKGRSRRRWACAGWDCTRCGVLVWGSELPVELAFAGGTQELKAINLLLISYY